MLNVRRLSNSTGGQSEEEFVSFHVETESERIVLKISNITPSC